MKCIWVKVGACKWRWVHVIEGECVWVKVLKCIWVKVSACKGGGMAQWREHSPPTSVARVRFPDPASNVGWVCWFSTLHWEVFSGNSGFPSPQKTKIWLDCVNYKFLAQMKITQLIFALYKWNKLLCMWRWVHMSEEGKCVYVIESAYEWR